MIVALAGAHGKIAMRLTAQLAGAGDQVIGLIRNPAHAADVAQQGANPVICDLEQASVEEIAAVIQGADAAVFAAGAGPGSGPERKLSLDRDGAIKLVHAAERAKVGRYLIISSVGAEAPPDDDDVFSVYLRAKAQADEAVRASELDWVIVRPGRLTDDPGRDRVKLSLEPFRGEVPREDVAAVLARLLRDASRTHLTLYLNSGPDSIEQAVSQLPAAGD